MRDAGSALARPQSPLRRRRRAELRDSSLPQRPAQSPAPAPRPAFRKKERSSSSSSSTGTSNHNRSGTATATAENASCGLFRVIEEASRCAQLFFDAFPTREDSADFQTTAPIVDDPLGWFLDVSVVGSEPMAVYSRNSPTSVSAAFPSTPIEEEEHASHRKNQPSLIQLSAHALTLIYDSVTSVRAWDTSFTRGPWPCNGQRRLATAHLHEEGTDGWNVVLGALELARAWGIRSSSDVEYLSALDAPHRLDRNTRMRLAVCLNLSWKFQRSCCSYFAPTFRDVGEFHGWPELQCGHTRELAFLGYAFLFPSEQQAFGPFSDANRQRIKELYQTILALEFDLLTSAPVFSLLTDNVQTRAELLLESFYLEKKVTSAVGLSARSILPFFLRAAISSDTYEELTREVDTGAEAIVCAACFCVGVAAFVPHNDAGSARRPPRFSVGVRQTALALLRAALLHNTSSYLRHGCYGDAGWANHVFVTEDTLRRAKIALRSAGTR